MTARRALLIALTILASALPAGGQVPQPAVVPAEAPEPARTELLRRRAALLEQRTALRTQVDAHNQRCRGVPERSPAAAECAQSQTRLNSAVAAYGSAVRDFNAAVAAVPPPSGPRRSLVAISVEEERDLGHALARELDATGTVVTDPAVTVYVSDLAARLAAHASTPGLPVTVRVVRDREVNAFAFPGGVIVINTGLLEAVRSEGELAAVIAHELGHVSRRHPVQATDALAQAIGVGIALGGPLSALAAPIVRQATAYKFERDQEREADRLAVETLYRAGIKPTGMVRLFDRWRREEPRAGLVDRLFLTHPTSEERLQSLAPLLADPRFNTLRDAESAGFGDMRRRVVGP